MQISNNNNINFTAKLDLTGVRKNKRMWHNVADMFEARTKRTSYTFRLDDSDREFCVQADTILKGGYDHEHSVALSKEATQKFMEMAPEKITQKLVKLLNVFKKHDETLETGLECLNKLEKRDKFATLTDTFDSGESFYDRIWGAIKDKANKDSRIALDKDRMFKNAEFIY